MTTTVLNDTFTDTAGTNLSSHTPETGGAWSLWSGSHIAQIASGGILQRNASASTAWTFAINATAHTYDNERVLFTVERTGSFTSWALVGLRASGSSSTATGYWCRVSGTQAEIWRTNNNSSVQLGATATISASTNGTYNFEFRVSNNGDLTTVTLELWLGGSLQFSRTDSTGSRLTARGQILAGLYNNPDHGLTSITATNDDPPATDTITITYPIGANGTPQQRTRGAMTGPLRVAGTYTGAPTAIQARVVTHGTSTPLSGFDWTTYDASPDFNVFDFDITGVPVALAWYAVEVRFSNDTGVTDVSDKTNLAAIWAGWGQSNMRFPFDTYGSSTLTPSDYCRVYGFGAGSGAEWVALDAAKMDGPIKFTEEYVTAGIPVAFLSSGVGGTAISTWNPGQTQYTNGMSHITAAGGAVEGILWIQGEADVDALTESQYLTELGDVFDTGARTTLADTNCPVILVMLGRQNVALNTDAGMEAIKAAQAAWCAAASTKNLRVERYDLTFASGHMADDVHLNAAGHRVLWPRMSRAARKASGEVSTYRGPRISSVSLVNSTTIDVTVTLDYGTDITAGSDGWRVIDGSAVTVSSVTRQSATVARLGLASSVTAPTVGFAYGKTPTVTSPLKDNSALTLPLEWSAGVGVTVIAAGTTNTATASLIAGTATGQQNATASGSTSVATASLTSGAATGQTNATATGQTMAAAASLIAGSASGAAAGTASGVTVAAAASLIAGAASGQVNATAAGVTLTAGASLIAGSAAAANEGTAQGVVIQAAALFIAGSATGDADATAAGQTMTATVTLIAGGAYGPSLAGTPGFRAARRAPMFTARIGADGRTLPRRRAS